MPHDSSALIAQLKETLMLSSGAMRPTNLRWTAILRYA
jgi:hypothetical protein